MGLVLSLIPLFIYFYFHLWEMCLCFKIWVESRQRGLSVERLNREAGEPREVGMQQGDRAELETRRWQKKSGAFGRPWVMEARRLNGGKAEGQNLQRETKYWGQVKTEKGRSLYWRAGTRQETGKGWTGGETSRKHLREAPSLHCTGKCAKGKEQFPCYSCSISHRC